MGDIRNNLRHLGMIATSPSWRRHFWHVGRIVSWWWRRA